MILPNNVSVLRNIKDFYYYNGIKISKENFDISEFALICSRINDFKQQFKEEKILRSAKQNHTIIGSTRLSLDNNIRLLCKIDNKNIYLGLYNISENRIIPLAKDIFKKIKDDDMYTLAYDLNRTANFILKGEIEKTTIKDSAILYTFENYTETIEKSGNSFQHTYELEFINGYKEYILTDEQLKQSLIER